MDQYMRDSVIDVKLAATTALNAVETLFAAYKADTSNEQLDEWVKLKNLEAIVSVRNQLQGIIDGR
jgi:hypothetical protein